MIYKVSEDRFKNDELAEKGEPYIYAFASTSKYINYPGIKRGFFNPNKIENEIQVDGWPEVWFFYDGKYSVKESAILMNIDMWPIIHKDVQKEFERMGITGLQYFPIYLADDETKHLSEDYVYMHILNYIDFAEIVDLEKSKYSYDEKYDIYWYMRHQIVLKEDSTNSYDIFYIRRGDVEIQVSQRIKDLFEEKKWFGWKFSEMKTI